MKLLLPWIVLLSACSIQASDDSELDAGYPDETIQSMESERFSSTNALQALDELESATTEFSAMTQDVRDEEVIILSDYEYADWELQNMGFTNWALAIKGALHHQNYRIHLLNYELALEQQKNGRVSSENVAKARSELADYEAIYEEFVTGATIVD